MDMAPKNNALVFLDKLRQLAHTLRIGDGVFSSRHLFYLLVAAPALLTAIYLWVFSPDRYVSTSRFVVYDADIAPISNDIFATLGLTNGQERNDLHLLQAFLLSPALLEIVDAELGVKEHYASSWDFMFGIHERSSFEDFIEYFHQRTHVHIDSVTGLAEIRTEGFDPEFSLALNQALLNEGERFINELNQNIAATEMRYAEQEMARSLAMLEDAQSRLTAYQSQTNLANPEVEGTSIITIVYEMEVSLAEAKAQYRETLTYLSADSPQAKALEARISSLEQQIAETKSRLTGTQSDGINQLALDYQELQLDVELAKIVYETSMNAFELARSQSTKKLRHLLVAAEPSLAEVATLPKRSYWLATLSLIYVCLYSIAMLALRSVAEHRE